MPALNIIAIQQTVRNSGSSSSLPSGMRPYLLSASHSEKITKPVAARTKSQPTLASSQSSADCAVEARWSVQITPQSTKAVDTAAVTP